MLRVVAYETRKDRVSTVDVTSSHGHKDTIIPCSNEGLENVSEACMIEVVYESFALGLIFLFLKFGGGEIAEKEICTHGGLPTDFLRNVANRHVNRVCRFISE